MKKAFSIFPNGSFQGEILLSIGHDFDTMMSKALKNNNLDWCVLLTECANFINKEDFGCVYDVVGNREYYIIFFKDAFDYSEDHYSKLSHEIVHLCQFCFPSILDRNTELEAEAYHHEYVMKTCLNILTNKK